MATLAESYNRAAVNLQDVNPSTGAPAFTYWRKAWLVDWGNEAIRIVFREVPQKGYKTFIRNPAPVLATNPTAEYVLATYEDLDQLFWVQAGNFTLGPKPASWLAAQYFDWDTRTGTPLWSCYNDFAPGVLKIVPDPGEYLTTVRAIASAKPPALVVTTDDDTPIPFDSGYHSLVEFYMTARGFAMNGETQNLGESDHWMGMFHAGLGEYRRKQAENFSRQAREVATDWF